MKEPKERPYYRKPPLSEQQINEICTRLNNDEPISQLALEYKIGTPIIYNHWKNHLKNKI